MHFSGLVIGPDVDGQMARYDENLEVESYMDICGWCSGSDPECQECHGSGKALCTRNPYGEWDYYRIGGRWRGLLALYYGRPGTLGELSYEWTYNDGPWRSRPRPSRRTRPPDWTGRADQALAGHVDWENTIAEMEDSRTYFMLAEGVWKAKEKYVPDAPYNECFVQDPNYYDFWDRIVRGLPHDMLVTVVDIHS